MGRCPLAAPIRQLCSDCFPKGAGYLAAGAQSQMCVFPHMSAVCLRQIRKNIQQEMAVRIPVGFPESQIKGFLGKPSGHSSRDRDIPARWSSIGISFPVKNGDMAGSGPFLSSLHEIAEIFGSVVLIQVSPSDQNTRIIVIEASLIGIHTYDIISRSRKKPGSQTIDTEL